ncbi:MAG TPA: hypothetical protein VGO90_08845 [Chthoniobacteraceae bacterium]|nr:hypothetical protein [Chthoniobacteraceae bacterium]
MRSHNKRLGPSALVSRYLVLLMREHFQRFIETDRSRIEQPHLSYAED